MSNRTEAATRKLRQTPPGGYRHCACSRLHTIASVQLFFGQTMEVGRALAMASGDLETSAEAPVSPGSQVLGIPCRHRAPH